MVYPKIMRVYRINSRAKVNLNLNVIKKSKIKKLHLIESLVCFVNLADKIYITKLNSNSHVVRFTGRFSKNITKKNAEEEGVEFIWLSSPSGFECVDDQTTGVQINKMRLGPPDITGRQSSQIIKDSTYVEEADLVIKALGFDPENIQNLWNCPELEFTRWGTVKTDFQTHLTNLSNVYAIGDISRGASLVVWAIRDGQEAAYEIVNKLKNKTTRVAE